MMFILHYNNALDLQEGKEGKETNKGALLAYVPQYI